jgi:alpha-tubulin suppressor-like RCC1 family protein
MDEAALVDLPLEVMSVVGKEVDLLDLPLEVLTDVCQQLDLRTLVRIAQTCKRFRHGDGGLEPVELPTKSPVVMALREHAFPGGRLAPSTRPVSSSESWVAYLARCARMRRYREATVIAMGHGHSLFVDEAGQLLACGKGYALPQAYPGNWLLPTSVAVKAGVSVRSVAAGFAHSLALGWDGRVYSWGHNSLGNLGQGDKVDRSAPTLVKRFEGVCGITKSLAVTQSGAVFTWGGALAHTSKKKELLRPTIVEGCGEVRVRRVCGGGNVAFTIGESGELFSWGDKHVACALLGHSSMQHQLSPKRVEALRGVRVSNVVHGHRHVLALAEDGLVYAWGENCGTATLGNPHVEVHLLPMPVEALRDVRVGSVAAAGHRSYAVVDTGEVWAWGMSPVNADDGVEAPLGDGEHVHCPVPKPLKSLAGIKVNMVFAASRHTLAVADNGRVYAWGTEATATEGALGLGASVSAARKAVPMPRLIPLLRMACGL